MADAKKCDMCGAFYDSPICNDPVIVKVVYNNTGWHCLDLCDVCYDKLCLFVAPALPKNCCVNRYKGEEKENEKNP